MRNLVRGHIAWEIGVWFLVIAVLPLAVIATISRHNSRNQIIKESTDHLRDIIHEKIERIEFYADQGKQSVMTLAKVPVVVQALKQTSQHFDEHGIGPDRLPELGKEVKAFLGDIQRRYGYHDIFLI